MKYLHAAIRRLAQALEDLPPQEGYPELKRDWRDRNNIPEPIGYVYHVSPYAQDILEQGFIIDPTRTTLGAFGELHSVSTTNYENAIVYKEGIKFLIGAVSGELTLQDMVDWIGEEGAGKVITHVMEEEFGSYWSQYDHFELLERNKDKPGGYTLGDAVDEASAAKIRVLGPEIDNYDGTFKFFKSQEGQAWASDRFMNGLDMEGDPVNEDIRLKRLWEFLKGAAYVSDLPAVIGYDPPEHLSGRVMDDVGIVEIAVAPVEWTEYPVDPMEQQLESIERSRKNMEEYADEYPEWTPEYIEERTKEKMERVVDPKGKYSYGFGEQEWKFFDVTDLWPIRIVGRLASAIKLLAQTLEFQQQHETTNPSWDLSYGGLPGAGGYEQGSEFLNYSREIAEAVHCTLGSLGKWETDWDLLRYYDEGHITEEVGLILKYISYGTDPYSLERFNNPEKYGLTNEGVERSRQQMLEHSPKLREWVTTLLNDYLKTAQELNIPEDLKQIALNAYQVVIDLTTSLEQAATQYPLEQNPYLDPELRTTAYNLYQAVKTTFPNFEPPMADPDDFLLSPEELTAKWDERNRREIEEQELESEQEAENKRLREEESRRREEAIAEKRKHMTPEEIERDDERTKEIMDFLGF